MPDKIGVAIIGATGMAGTGHLAGYHAVPGTEVRVIWDRDLDRARALAQEHGIPIVAETVEEACGRAKVEIVSICTPDHLHADHATAALAAGKHVLCEKPMCTTVEDARRMVDAVRQSGKKLMVGMCYRFIPLSRAIYTAYRRGDVGEVFLADGNYRSSLGQLAEKTPWRFDPHHPQDILLGGTCHSLDMLRWLMDVTVEEVHGFANHKSEPLYTIDDCYSVHCKFSNGAIGRLCAMSGARAHTPDSSGVSLWGTKGTIWDGRLYADSRRETADLREQAPPLSFPVTSSFGLPWGDELAHFVECVCEDRPPMVDVIHGAQTVAALCAGIESARTGKPVRPVQEF
jgi:UDP-N-acetylglucosamine 3-dehydrogenase